jgi:SOS-response transcriptional repressor LexA
VMTLTRSQANALVFLIDFQDRNGFAPTYRQMAEGLGLSSASGVHRVIGQLQERGALIRHGAPFAKAAAYEIVRPRPIPKATFFLRALIERLELDGSIRLDDPLVQRIRANMRETA